MNVKLSQDCNRCWKSEKLLGQYVCTKAKDDGCLMMDIYKQEARRGVNARNRAAN